MANDPHTVFNSLIGRRLSGELSPEEEKLFQDLVSQNPDLKTQLSAFEKIWDSVDGLVEQQEYDVDAEWRSFSKKIPDLAEKSLPSAKGRSLLFYTYRIAAVLLVGLLFSFAWIYLTQRVGTTQVVAKAEPMEILLEDGTKVWLNRDSKLRYKKQFSEHSREITLSGEGWFDVARDTSRPFVIDAGLAMVEVLGTSFNVNAYKENPSVEITVESGIVAVSAKKEQEEQIVLRAGNSGSYNSQSQELILRPTYDPNSLSWKTRELYFEDSPLSEVVSVIARVYNVEIEVSREDLAACPITVSFNEQSLEAVLKVLEMTLDLDISRSGDSIILDGEACVE